MNKNPIIIALIGPTGVGKTTIGKLLAQHLDYTFVDLDACIEERLGADIDWIFQLEGEIGFRKHEAIALRELLRDIQTNTQKNTVLSTGGGSVLTQANRKLLEEKTTIIYLAASLTTLLERTMQTKGRPLLAGDDRKARLQKILEERRDIYEALADFSIAVDQLSTHDTVRIIEDHIKALRVIK